MARLGRLIYTVQDSSGNAVSGISVEVRKRGATVEGAHAGATTSFTVDSPGRIITTSENVVAGTGTTTRSVASTTATNVTVGAPGFPDLADGTRLSPSTNLPTLYADEAGDDAKSNPLTSSATGLVTAWLPPGFYDLHISGTGVTTTLVQDVRAEGQFPWLDVRYYGAVGDGSTDDSTAIQAAIDDAELRSVGTIFFPAATYKISVELTLTKNINLVGEHTPSNDATLTPEGTVFLRGADVIMINMTGTNRSTDRIGRSHFSGIHFKDGTNLSNKSVIFGKYADNMVIENCTFSAPAANTTNGHMIDAEECWDWSLLNCIFWSYGDTSDSKYAINIFNGEDNNCNGWHIDRCLFYNGNGKCVVSDVSGAGSARNADFHFSNCKFEDNSADNALEYFSGVWGHTFFNNCIFNTGSIQHVKLEVNSVDINFEQCFFQSLKAVAAATEYIEIAGTQKVRIINCTFSGADTTHTDSFIHLDATTGQNKDCKVIDCDFTEGTLFDTPMVRFIGVIHNSVEIKNNGQYQNQTLTADAQTIPSWPGATSLDSGSNKVDCTLGNGIGIGDIRTVVMTEASNESDLSVTLHLAADPSTFVFNAIDEAVVLMWTGTEWITVVNAGTS